MSHHYESMGTGRVKLWVRDHNEQFVVLLEIDRDAVLWDLADRARRNRQGVARAMHGGLKLTITQRLGNCL